MKGPSLITEDARRELGEWARKNIPGLHGVLLGYWYEQEGDTRVGCLWIGQKMPADKDVLLEDMKEMLKYPGELFRVVK